MFGKLLSRKEPIPVHQDWERQGNLPCLFHKIILRNNLNIGFFSSHFQGDKFKAQVNSQLNPSYSLNS